MKKNCAVCGKEFDTERDAQIYCSRQCCDKRSGQIRRLLPKLGLKLLFCIAHAESGEHYSEETHGFDGEDDKKRFTLAAREFYETVLDGDFDTLKKIMKA